MRFVFSCIMFKSDTLVCYWCDCAGGMCGVVGCGGVWSAEAAVDALPPTWYISIDVDTREMFCIVCPRPISDLDRFNITHAGANVGETWISVGARVGFDVAGLGKEDERRLLFTSSVNKTVYMCCGSGVGCLVGGPGVWAAHSLRPRRGRCKRHLRGEVVFRDFHCGWAIDAILWMIRPTLVGSLVGRQKNVSFDF